MPRRSRRPVLAFLLLIQVFLPAAVFAQATTATLKGRVVGTDKVGLPGVVVALRSREEPTGNKQSVTDIEGNYRIPLLPVANDYVLRVAYPGFAPVEVGPIDLDAGKTVVQDVTLRSDAESTETVVVESQGNIVDTESTKTSTSYNAEFIEGLPIIGHNYQDILTLAPGVTDTDGDGNPNVHGARDTGLQYRLDGGNITDPLTGAFGQNLNAEMIEEIEVITSGASAEYGRADGGFANIITKSGGNDFEGSFKIYWRGKFLDGNGAGNNDAAIERGRPAWRPDPADFRDIRSALTLGGAIVKDRLWYFGTVEMLDTETPHNFVGSSALTTSRGNYSFVKVTWQASAYNKLSLQATADPRTFTGLNLGQGVAPESDYEFRQGGLVPQLKWTSTISPMLLLESTITSFNSRVQIRPVSHLFHPTTVPLKLVEDAVQAIYPCPVINCAPEAGAHDIYQINQFTGQVTGPYWLRTDQRSARDAIKTDLSLTVEDAWGQHGIKSGFEFQNENYRDAPISNPILFDDTGPYMARDSDQPSSLDRVSGYQVLLTFQPLITPQSVASFNSGAYLLDSWKPRPNLTVNLGVRIDREDIDSSGYTFFDPRRERRAAVRLWRSICAAADRLDRATDEYGLVPSENCYQYTDNVAAFDGKPSEFGEALPLDHPAYPVTDPAIRRLDLDGDGAISKNGADGDALMSGFTTYDERQTTNFSIVNNNLAPRSSVSWDPRADGRTKVFGTWGRYYDRLFLGTVAQEIGPDSFSYLFFPNQLHVIAPGSTSLPRSRISITQTDRSLSTPRTDELSLGFERELAPEWSVGVTLIRRHGRDLLQDSDLNHITCTQHALVGVDPKTACWNGSRLDTDRFGDIAGRLGHYAEQTYPTPGGPIGSPGFNAAAEGGRTLPNGAPDLYTVSFNFNRVLRVANVNSYDYEALELKLVKRLHRNWQMQASYTWSEASGQAESFVSTLGNDPETEDDEEGYLTYDQRHVLKFQAVTRLPHDIALGGIVQWSSGTPWSVVRTISELDSAGNTLLRTFYPSSQRNDRRNEGVWDLDARVEKSFEIGRTQAGAFLNIDNVLNSDDLTILRFNEQVAGGAGLSSYRNFGRRFELGASFRFQ